ncbi:MAG: hypothetical protein GF350_10480 [Chitinivibrionales bacterium]|nr:hypothetical protein [Chitinivibrionales bacterium]
MMNIRVPVFFLFLAVAVPLFAENSLSLKIGPLWPRKLLDTDKKTAWDAAVEYGILIDKKIAFGVGADFMWNRSTQDKDTTIDTSSSPGPDEQKTIQKDIKSFMFPLSAFIYIDPLSHLLFHPLIQFNIGYMPHIYSQRGKEIDNKSHYYHGLFLKLALDGVYSFSENIAIIAGAHYQWANTRRRDRDDRDIIYYRNMSGFGLHAGFLFNF